MAAVYYGQQCLESSAKMLPAAEKIKVADIMTKKVISIHKGASLKAAAKLLLENTISCLPVVNAGKTVGIITDKDFLKLATMNERPKKVSEIMSTELVTISPNGDLLLAGKLMGKHRIRHLIVTERGKTVGILSLRDVLKVEPCAIYEYISQKA